LTKLLARDVLDMTRLFAVFVITAALSGSALAQGSPGDARFCQSYAANVSGIGRLAIKKNPACLDYSKGVHGDYTMHYDWCMKTPASSVQGAEANIRRLVSACTGNAAPAPRQPAAPVAQDTRPPLAGKSFYLNTEGADEPGLCIDIAGGQLREGTPIQLWKCHQQAPQRFGVIGPGRVYAMMAQHLCVDGNDREQLRLVNCQSMRRQWRVDARTNTIRSNDGLCWDVTGGNVRANLRQRQPIIAWRCHNGINQQFVLNN
jgi:hypothetical protein